MISLDNECGECVDAIDEEDVDVVGEVEVGDT